MCVIAKPNRIQRVNRLVYLESLYCVYNRDMFVSENKLTVQCTCRPMLTLKVPEKLQLYRLYVYNVVHVCDFGMLRVNGVT